MNYTILKSDIINSTLYITWKLLCILSLGIIPFLICIYGMYEIYNNETEIRGKS